MDIFLTADAARTLEAVRRLPPVKGSRGFLLGHRRGDRFYIESILPSPSSAWPSLKAFYELDTDLGGKIIGFFIVGSSPAVRMPLLKPFGTGKVLIEIPAGGGGKRAARGALIDYRDRFEFRKIPVIIEDPVR
ncbi:MAG: hypothetical protein NTW38_11765 [Candidatus Aminicenantes bacterium]|nr:hypothetical protein [Candidatus Aminicenantes bacterium]